MDEVKVDHIGIATKSIKDSSLIWEILGFTESGEEIVADQGVKVKIFSADEGPKTLQEIGDIFGVTRMRICQIEKSIKKKLSNFEQAFDQRYE